MHVDAGVLSLAFSAISALVVVVSAVAAVRQLRYLRRHGCDDVVADDAAGAPFPCSATTLRSTPWPLRHAPLPTRR
jgi:hypothetical protein